MKEKICVGGYVKLAKLWERNFDAAIQYHRKYYEEKYVDSPPFQLFDVYVDITGKREIIHRPEMLRLINDCALGRINCIAAQTRGYLAANTKEFCFLLLHLVTVNPTINLITEDAAYNINTIENVDSQREALIRMAQDYVSIARREYERWEERIVSGIAAL